MKKKWIVALVLCLLVAGCEDVAQMVVDPNSGLNVGVDAVSEVLPAVTIGATTAAGSGVPWAPVVLLVTNIAAGLIAAYKNHQKNVTEDKYENVAVTTKAIVDAVEAVSEIKHEDTTVGDIIKAKVEDKLKDKDYYLIGKIVIDTLKGE